MTDATIAATNRRFPVNLLVSDEFDRATLALMLTTHQCATYIPRTDDVCGTMTFWALHAIPSKRLFRS
jgi:hypothetical protein